ncbi:ferric reductase-like transmembrane domain-containing protein [Actinomadura barringtoniae]|uniref:Ferric reductase-like transmembrane domain-containing protein n=1 Tax=Actinomadura barringtoniae TaxID=1427535 RepID=A0A939PJD0_9ACTN|nr:ferric reductase-like transmembrane domain-containing protein [Actinomadura barringtoniae]MBO2453455.1 ferric reductase-like transmembrane domain-containing protein [Actinomadura barringtoniae]
MTTTRAGGAGVRAWGAPPAHRRAWRPPASWPLLLIFAGGGLVLALWWIGTRSVTGLDGWLTEAGRVTGLLAGYGCAVLLALMARVPALERGVGTDRLARWHAAGGRYTVFLALAHVLLIITGYAVTARTDPVRETVRVVVDYPEMLKATAGFLLLVGVGITSARAARRRLSYETWHYLHFATYLAVFLAFFHQLANGAQFVSSPWARLFWYSLYIGVAVFLAWYRFLVPIRRGLRHQLRVADVRLESPGVVSVYMTGHHLDDLGAEPGQFFRWRFLTPGMWWAANPYSLSAPPRDDCLRITVKVAGDHSRALARLRPGIRVWAEGPYGSFTGKRRRSNRALLLAGGVGITPLRTLFETLPGDLVLVYLARTSTDLALYGELEAIAVARGARALYFVDEPSDYSLPLTGRALLHLIPDLVERDVYLCGPPGMAEAARKALAQAGVRNRDVHFESFEF